MNNSPKLLHSSCIQSETVQLPTINAVEVGESLGCSLVVLITSSTSVYLSTCKMAHIFFPFHSCLCQTVACFITGDLDGQF